MKKFNYSIDDDISFQEKYQITPNELFILKILLLLQEDAQDIEYFQRFIQVPANKEILRSSLQSLQNKSLILNTINFIKEINFSKLHVFPYSKRDNTVAAKLNNIVSDDEKKVRANKLIELSNNLELDYAKKFINKESLSKPIILA